MDAWIEKVVDIHFSSTTHDKRNLGPAVDKLLDSLELSRFLNNEDKNIASLYISKQKARFFYFYNDEIKTYLDLNIEQCDLSNNTIVLTKKQPGHIVSDPSEIIITPVSSNSPGNALFQVIHDVFVPILRNSRFNIKDKTRSLLSDLDASLVSEMGRSVTADMDVASVNCLADELKYWEKQAAKFQGRDRERALFFKDSIQNLNVELEYA
ncbi:hypothetical protein HK100_007200, partial [Physocladia obscura]